MNKNIYGFDNEDKTNYMVSYPIENMVDKLILK